MLIIKKYGGSSLATSVKIELVASKIAQTYYSGKNVVIVVSAMGNSTDKLLTQASNIFADILPTQINRELDALMSCGEQVSSALLAIALNKLNVPAKSYNAWQIGLLTDNRHQNANFLRFTQLQRIKDTLAQGIVPVISGFQGVNLLGDITTLGRNSSDLSAVIVAKHLQADECLIHTDVDGIYDLDPHKHHEAKKFATLSVDQALTIAKAGAKVMAVKALKFLQNNYLPVRILHYDEASHGTVISESNVRAHRITQLHERMVANQMQYGAENIV